MQGDAAPAAAGLKTLSVGGGDGLGYTLTDLPSDHPLPGAAAGPQRSKRRRRGKGAMPRSTKAAKRTPGPKDEM